MTTGFTAGGDKALAIPIGGFRLSVPYGQRVPVGDAWIALTTSMPETMIAYESVRALTRHWRGCGVPARRRID